MLSTQYSFLPFLHFPSPVTQGLTLVAITFSFFHHPTASCLFSGPAEWQLLCHVCPHCIFALQPCSSPPSGVILVLALLHYLQVLCTNSVLCSFSLKWFPAMAAMRFLQLITSGMSIPYLNGPSWPCLYVLNYLQSEFGFPVSKPIIKLDILCWRTTSETQESQLHKAAEENQAYNTCLYSKLKSKHSSCATFLLVVYFKQQTSYLQLCPQHQKTIRTVELFCYPVSRLSWCNNRGEILIPLSFWNV